MARMRGYLWCFRPSFILAIALISILLAPVSIVKAGDGATAQGSFTIALAISNIKVSSVATSAATISWTTNTATTSQVFYDAQFHSDIADYAYHTEEDTALVTEHDIRLTGLSSVTTYHFRVRSVTDDIEAISNDYTFTTQTPSAPGPGPEPPDYYEKVNLFGETSEWRVSHDGRLLGDVEITSKDGKTNVYIPKGTSCLDKEGNRLRELVIKVEEEAPEPPRNYLVIGTAYDFGPDGATFTPYLELTLFYEEEDISEGLEEEDLVIAYYDEGTKEWVELGSVVDAENNVVTAFIEHFTTFAIIGMVPPPPPPVPAGFVVSGLAITPGEVYVGESVSIMVMVANTGGESGSCNVTLKINGTVEEVKKVTVNAGLSKEVTFITSKDTADTYWVNVNGLTGSFTVKEELVPVAPAAFIISDLAVLPTEVYVGEMVSIKVLVTNTGEESGSRVVTLKINGVVEATKEITLAPRDSESITFATSRDVAGAYLVDVNGLTGTFTVKEKEVPFIKPVNWPLIGGVAGGLIAVGLLIYFLVVRKKRRKAKGEEVNHG
jgi:hypothetical protein